jgi:hypothetical protein
MTPVRERASLRGARFTLYQPGVRMRRHLLLTPATHNVWPVVSHMVGAAKSTASPPEFVLARSAWEKDAPAV